MSTLDSEELLVTDHTGRQFFNKRLLQSMKNGDNATLMTFAPKIDKDYSLYSKVDTFGRTLLYYAIDYNHEPLAKRYIKLGFNIEALDNFGKSPIHIALERKNALILRWLAKEIWQIYIDDEIGQRWLRIIIRDPECGKKNVPEILFPKMITKCRDDEKLANILIKEKCDLCYAISFGKPSVTKILIDQGFSIDAKDREGNTALHLAVRSGHIENVKLLLQHGANVNVQNKKGQIPINHETNLFKTIEEQEILKLLVDHGSDLFVCDITNRWQIDYILHNGLKEAVEILLNLIAILHAENQDSKIVLHHLTKNHNPGVFELVILLDIDINIPDKFGITPLLHAVIDRNEIACRILLDKGANINAITKARLGVPLFYAIKFMGYSKCEQFLELFLERGANAQFLNKHGQTVFAFLPKINVRETIEILLGHFALIESLGTIIIKQIRDEIEANDSYKTHYDTCKKQLENMKTNPIYENITFLKLMTDNEKKVAGYMRNKDILLKIKKYNSKYHSNSYCNKQFEKRITNAIKFSELTEKAAVTFYNIMNAMITLNFDIVYEIISYLTQDDLLILTSI